MSTKAIELLQRVYDKAMWYASNPARQEQEVDHALCVEVPTELQEVLELLASDLQAQGEETYTKQEVEALLRDCEEWVETMTDGRILLKFDTIARKHGLNTDTHV